MKRFILSGGVWARDEDGEAPSALLVEAGRKDDVAGGLFPFHSGRRVETEGGTRTRTFAYGSKDRFGQRAKTRASAGKSRNRIIQPRQPDMERSGCSRKRAETVRALSVASNG